MPLSYFSVPRNVVKKRPPQAVDIAIFSGYNVFGGFPSTWLGTSKQCFRFVAGFQELPAISAVSDNLNPFDIMGLFHRMRNRSHFDQNPLLGLLNDRHVLFIALILGFFDQQLHGLAAANQLASGRMDNFHDIAADAAPINLFELSHVSPLKLPSFSSFSDILATLRQRLRVNPENDRGPPSSR